MTSEEVVFRLSEQARGSVQDIVNPDTGSIDVTYAIEHGKAHLIRKYKYTEKDDEKRVEVEMYSAQEALKELWKIHQLAQGKPTGKQDDTLRIVFEYED